MTVSAAAQRARANMPQPMDAVVPEDEDVRGSEYPRFLAEETRATLGVLPLWRDRVRVLKVVGRVMPSGRNEKEGTSTLYAFLQWIPFLVAFFFSALLALLG